MIKIPTTLVILSLLVLNGACSTTPYYEKLGLQPHQTTPVQKGDPFQHTLLTNAAAASHPNAQHWHVYIDGDGRPVNRWGKPSADPSPKRSLIWQWMARDSQPAIYLGRPCYLQSKQHKDPLCTPIQWTLARYSDQTVSSMVTALEATLPPQATITLIGHSGGGTLAVLMAPRLRNRVNLVTINGNLQVGKWTQHHGFTPLDQSLDPMTEPVLSACIEQRHFAGAKDEEILWQWVEEFSKKQPNSHFQKLDNADHRQNWPDWWQLTEFSSNINQKDCGKVTPLAQP